MKTVILIVLFGLGLFVSILLFVAAGRRQKGKKIRKQTEYFRYSRNYSFVSALVFLILEVRVWFWEFKTAAGVALIVLGVFSFGVLWIGFRCFQAAVTLDDVDESHATKEAAVSIGRRPGFLNLFLAPTAVAVRLDGSIRAYDCSLRGASLFFDGEADQVEGRLTGSRKVQGLLLFPGGRRFMAPAEELRRLKPEIE